MATIIEEKERRVIPNWRSFGTTVSLGELDLSSKNTNSFPVLSIDSYISDFRSNQSVPFAADLLSASLVNGFTNNKDVEAAARFLLNHQNETTVSQRDLACKILYGPGSSRNDIENITIKQLDDCISEQDFINRIKELKQYLISYPNNSIAWVELSRCYSILGQEKKALQTMKYAVQLSPNNRFVIRCATRLFSHYDELDLAQYVLRHCSILKKDPWLLSAEVAVNTLRGKVSNLLKRGTEILDSSNYSPFSTTELAASIATVHLLAGDRKKSRKLFTKSLVSPNDNSIAQIEWVLNSKDKNLLDKDTIVIETQHGYEAMAINNYYSNNLIEALNNTCQWFCDMPFSKRPVMMGSSIADLLDNKKLAITFLKKGLVSNSNDCQILNNIAYYYALENNTFEASKYIDKIDNKSVDIIDGICITATKGLIKFRERNYECGRELYLRAINGTTKTGNKELNYKAILNYTREELLAGSDYIEAAINLINEMKDVKNMSIEIKKLHSEVVELYKKYKANAI